MSIQIIRNNITKVHVDAIVNIANPEPVYASGTNGAVNMAAGTDQLLKKRRRIGQLRTGEAIVTKTSSAFSYCIILHYAWKTGAQYDGCPQRDQYQRNNDQSEGADKRATDLFEQRSQEGDVFDNFRR